MKSFILIAGLLSTCKTGPETAPGPTCAMACDRMRALGCEAGKPTPHGVSCEDVCMNARSSGMITLDLQCMSTALDCDTVDKCGTGR